MTANSLSIVQSAPFTGLGTQAFNITATGIYTVQTRVTIPWMSSDQPAAAASVPTRNVQTITAVADSSGSLNSTYWTFYTAGDVSGYYVWYNINSAGVDPAVSGLTGIAVTGATNATASTLGGATRTAIAAVVTAATVSGSTSATILTNVSYGACTAAADGTAATGFTFATGTAGTFGAGSGLTIKVKKQSTVIATYSLPTPSQASMGGSVVSSFTAADVMSVVLTSLASADNLPNAVKGVINIFAGE